MDDLHTEAESIIIAIFLQLIHENYNVDKLVTEKIPGIFHGSPSDGRGIIQLIPGAKQKTDAMELAVRLLKNANKIRSL